MALQTKEKVGSTSISAWTFKQKVIEKSIAEDNNSSAMTVELFLGRADSTSYVGGSFSCYVTLEGKKKSFSGTIPYPTYIDAGKWYSLGKVTFNEVEHNDDGTKTVSIKSTMSSSDFTPSSASVSDTMTLTPIEIGSVRIAINNEYKRAIPYIGLNGKWEKCKAYIGVNGKWKKGM